MISTHQRMSTGTSGSGKTMVCRYILVLAALGAYSRTQGCATFLSVRKVLETDGTNTTSVKRPGLVLNRIPRSVINCRSYLGPWNCPTYMHALIALT